MSQRRYFGTDGIRGRVGEGPISADFVLKLGWAAGRALAREGHATVVIGKDTRISGYMFESALEAGLVAAGANVKLLGPIPTPGVAYLTRSLRADAGIVISASHNPHHDNGIKFFSAHGEKLCDATEHAIESALDEPFSTVASEALGKASRVSDAAARYAEFCKSTVSEDFSLRGMRIAMDCANGANYQIAPQLFRELGAELIVIGAEPDGLNINAGCGSTHLAALQQRVQQGRTHLGIAFDGDGDRVLFVDADGSVVDGDELLYVLAMDRAAMGNKPKIVVGTLMSNYGLERAFQHQGIDFSRAKVGDRYVHQQLIECGAVLGGEASGHLLVLDRASTGDGIVSALQVLQAIRRSGQTLAQLKAAVMRVPQQTINVRIDAGSKPLDSVAVREAAALAEERLRGRGRLVLRPSGTEPVVRITVEADEQALLDSVLSSLSAAVHAAA
ncbi:MAG: Phosphoglucosamine mutase [Alphaproteobacteria bacterium ADurb.BinA280]|jgi:phosphoglucosamine mutase|nr:phosphoglucosamine mutase [Xanthomonadales bacterium]MCC6505628.1 phosphoglucosamine mutase [Aquimonas sp.]OPZ12884.1 MAG: Phosphoglucosamine mutase [Alphaproteobacteria bacterium ADurb.BinA280]